LPEVGQSGVGALTVSNIAIAERVARDIGLAVRFRLLDSLDTGRADVIPPTSSPSYSARANIWHRVTAFLLQYANVTWSSTSPAATASPTSMARQRFFRIALAKAVALAARRPRILSSQTIGKFRWPWARWFAHSTKIRMRGPSHQPRHL
jgi:hypothetical protein